LNGNEILCDRYANVIDGCDYILSATKLKQFELSEALRRSYYSLAAKLKEFELAESRRYSIADHYPMEMEYSDLVSCMSPSELEVISMILNEQNVIRRISALERTVLSTSKRYACSSQAPAIDTMETRLVDGMLWDRLQEKELLENPICNRDVATEKTCNQSSLQCPNFTGSTQKSSMNMKSIARKYTDLLESSQEDQNRKSPICRHFLRGHCKRGKSCDFLHDHNIFCPDSQKVFLGGLPGHITESTLRQALAQQGFNVINKPIIFPGFTPEVCVASVEQAHKLIQKRTIFIDGCRVDVRAYEALQGGGNKTYPDEIKRSVFLGGLPKGTTGQMIKDSLKKMDVKVVNHPITKTGSSTGFSPKVTLSKIEETNMLVRLKQIFINENMVDVRPYANMRPYHIKSSIRSSKKTLI